MFAHTSEWYMGVVWFESWFGQCPEALFGFPQSMQAISGMVH